MDGLSLLERARHQAENLGQGHRAHLHVPQRKLVTRDSPRSTR